MHRGALCRVRQLYVEHRLKKARTAVHLGRPGTSTSGTRPAWLDAVKTHAQTIF